MPLDSLYQTTKFSIEQGILDMQQKIRQKNELDLQRQLTQTLLQQQRLYRQEKQLLQLQRLHPDANTYNNKLMQRTACDPYVNSILYDSSLHNDPAQLEYLQLKEAIRREAEHLQYLKRLQRMKAQTLALNRPYDQKISAYEQSLLINQATPIRQFSNNRLNPYQPKIQPSNQIQSAGKQTYRNLQYDQSLEEDSSALLQKYNKGIRAQQYNRDMERLLEIQKRIKKIQQNSIPTSAYRQVNESLVSPYKYDKYQQNQYTQKKRQTAPYHISPQQNIHEAQRPIKIQQPQDRSQQYRLDNNKVDMFENQRIGQLMNKRLEQNREVKDQMSQKNYPKLDRIDKLIRNNPNAYHLAKPSPLDRPHSSKPRNSNKRSVSKSNYSALSPLKSQRKLTKRQSYKPLTKDTRSRAKSSKQKNSRSNYEPSNAAKQIRSRLISLDPNMQNFYEQIIKKQINQKIQNRLQLLTCVFRDVKMRNQRNEKDTLLQRFQIECRGRKQIKTMINNDPKILKKHKMVIG